MRKDWRSEISSPWRREGLLVTSSQCSSTSKRMEALFTGSHMEKTLSCWYKLRWERFLLDWTWEQPITGTASLGIWWNPHHLVFNVQLDEVLSNLIWAPFSHERLDLLVLRFLSFWAVLWFYLSDQTNFLMVWVSQVFKVHCRLNQVSHSF